MMTDTAELKVEQGQPIKIDDVDSTLKGMEIKEIYEDFLYPKENPGIDLDDDAYIDIDVVEALNEAQESLSKKDKNLS